VTGRVVIATCRRWPELSASDSLYAEALKSNGVDVQHAPWNGEFDWAASGGAVVLRSTWDYHHDIVAFRTWLDRLDAAGIPLINPPELVRWNLDKRYLLELQNAEIPVPRTLVCPRDPATLDQILKCEGWTEAVLKPAWGASGFAVERVTRGGGASALLASDRRVLLQEFLPEIAAGEFALVFFGGRFSHAVIKRPQAGEFRVNSQYGGQVERIDVTGKVREAGMRVLDALPTVPVYARIDGVLRNGAFVVMEVELLEPGLWLHLAPGAAQQFAAATLERLVATAFKDKNRGE
jgi:glutathione synthase/RimK-type ligase-like ATP-grasp enzyme